MPTRDDVERLSRAAGEAVRLAQRDLQSFARTLDAASPEVARDALLEFVPELVTTYGELAATAASEWYEDIRVRELGEPYTSKVGATQDVDAARGSVRYAAGSLFDEGAGVPATVAILNGAVQRHVSYASRDTIRREVRDDPRRPRFARVPAGSDTCAFCRMLASRGWVYHSEASAGDTARRGVGDDFHDDCDCQIVPEFEKDQTHIEGYDPDELYDQYQSVHGQYDTAADVAAKMREAYGYR